MSRRRFGGRAGLVGAVALIGLATALAAALVTTSILDETATGRAVTAAPTRAELAGPAADATADAGRPPPARPVLRVSEGAAPAAGQGGAGSTSPTTATPPTTTPSNPSSTPGDPETVVPDAAASEATSTSLTPAPIELADRDARFVTLPPGSSLPSGADCAARVRPTPENVPENRTRNQTRGGPVSGTYLSDNPSIAANGYESRIDGDFVGSTDEIIQWAACKWGFDEDVLRAQVYAESTWYAGKLGDCGEATVPETGGCASVGLIQVRSAESGATHHPGVYPQAWTSSALNLDYGLAVHRLCFEGLESWLGQTGPYRAGDQWNCMGRWFSGSWADPGSADYQAKIRDILARRPWETWVGCRDWQTNNHCGG